MFHMKQILVQLDEHTAKQLEQVAPGNKRKRSKFIRNAIVKALLEVYEEVTRRSYEREPDDSPDEPFDPSDWLPEKYAIHPTPAQKREIAKARKRRERAAARRPKRSK